MTSVVIAAHNEARVIGRCLDALLAGAQPGEFDVTVVANGCTDDTAAAAARPGVRVLDLPEPGKAGALNAGDRVAVGFPRVYLDADIVIDGAGLRTLTAAVSQPGVLAVVPRRVLDLTGRPLLVRAYFAINRRLPAYADALFGRGVIVLSQPARGRFAEFPGMVADDLFLDSLFTPAEKREVATVTSRVATPRRTADLLRRLVRVRAGNAQLRAVGSTTGSVRRSARLSWLRDVVIPRPWLAPAALCYVGLTVLAGARARRAGRGGSVSWGHDVSTRAGAGSSGRTDG